jgi:Transposase, Mutator family
MGTAWVVRSGHHQAREVLTSVGVVQVTAPRVNDERVTPDTGERQRFSSAILPAWARKTPKATEVLPLLYLHGLSTGDFGPALGPVPRLDRWHVRTGDHETDRAVETDQRVFAELDLSDVDYVYLWADGIHVNIRLERSARVAVGRVAATVKFVYLCE